MSKQTAAAISIAGLSCYLRDEGAGGASEEKALTSVFPSATRLRAGTVITHLFSHFENL